MPAVLALAALAVVVATVVLARGRGGALVEALPDHPPSGLPADRLPRASDARRLRLPKSPWGYHAPMTDDALIRLADALAVREEQVERLERELAVLRSAPPADKSDLPHLSDLSGDAGSTALEPWEIDERPAGGGDAQEEPWKSSQREQWRREEGWRRA
ncbi:hypothetical protein LO762_02330 [Actinocorallia sp. API 0066]|uniref:hypothetical protein n=1 Tax=Actinocorallia sp. API 0066 TaxID=2896846 RepID=UPI001E4B2A78|nr:hypothetical protein [Actinocorallia sp. API 0066]MCD0448038.1 hypothetical protein [Actinocorallia sp. API 0066]